MPHHSPWWLGAQTWGPDKSGDPLLAGALIPNMLPWASNCDGDKGHISGSCECTAMIPCVSEGMFKQGGYGGRKWRGHCFLFQIHPGDKRSRGKERNQDRRTNSGCTERGWLARWFYFTIDFILLVTFGNPLFMGHNSFSADEVYFQKHLLGCYPSSERMNSVSLASG